MIITLISSSFIKPAEPTWSGRLPLSELDQTGSIAHVPAIYLYSKPSQDWDIVLQTLKTSLSTTLVYFYPLACRLSALPGGRVELDCNAAGVQFTEAYADIKVADLNDFLQTPLFDDHLIPSVDYRHTTIEEIPLLLLQITKFTCGGWSLGFRISHVVIDGQSAFHFLSVWARVSRGEPVGSSPHLDRKCLRAGEPSTTTSPIIKQHVRFNPPPIVLGQSSVGNGHKKEDTEATLKLTEAMLKLTETQVQKLQNKANESRKTDIGDRGFTRFEAVTAHIWRTACKVWKLEPEQATAVGICIDVRTRMMPPLPEKYFGNAVLDVFATGTSGEILSESSGYVSTKIRDVIRKVDDKYVNSVINFLKCQEDVSKFQDLQGFRDDERPFCRNRKLWVVSWLSLPMYAVDFGWGKELFTGPVWADGEDGEVYILRGAEGDGSLVVALCLHVKQMEDFTSEFYQDIED